MRSSGKRPSKGKRKSDDKDRPAPKSKKQKVAAAPLPANATIIAIDDEDKILPQVQGSPPTTTAGPGTSAGLPTSPPSFVPSSSPQGTESSTDVGCSMETISASSGSVEPPAAISPPLMVPRIEPPSPNVKRTMSNEPGPNAEEVAAVSSKASSRVTRRTCHQVCPKSFFAKYASLHYFFQPRVNVLYVFEVPAVCQLKSYFIAMAWLFPLLRR